jgi:hypothetical protein
MIFARTQRSFFLLVLACFTLLSLTYHYGSNVISHPAASPEPVKSKGPFSPGVAESLSEIYTWTLVMARLKWDDVSWTQELEGLNRSIYTDDDENSSLAVPKNKGHESMVYLTYMINNCDNLPDTVLFVHPHRTARHNNVLLDLDSKKTIERLSDAKVACDGYFNARCHLDPGCPSWLYPDRPLAEWDFVHKNEERFFTPRV